MIRNLVLSVLLVLAGACSGVPYHPVSQTEVTHRPKEASVRVEDPNIGGGSGVVVYQDAKRAIVLTVAHVVERMDSPAPAVTVTIGGVAKTKGVLIYYNALHDTAAYKTPPVWSDVLNLAPKDVDWNGAKIECHAWPGGVYEFDTGKVVDVAFLLLCPQCGKPHGPYKDREFIANTISVRGGYSGSAIVVEHNQEWKVLGLQQLGWRNALGRPVEDREAASNQENTWLAYTTAKMILQVE